MSKVTNGRGRPIGKSFPNRESVRINDEQKAHLIQKYGGVTSGVRLLIDRDIALPDSVVTVEEYVQRLVGLSTLAERKGLSLDDIEQLIKQKGGRDV